MQTETLAKNSPSVLASANGALTSSQLENFRDAGYIALSGVLSGAEVAECRKALAEIARATISQPADYEAKTWRDSAYFQHRTSRLSVQIEPGSDPATLTAD